MAGFTDTIDARLVTRTIKGKEYSVVLLMIDPMRFPVADIADLYAHRWEIELGYHEMKQYMLKNELTLRSKKPEMVRQELWDALLAYNLIRYQIVKMAYSLDSILPIQLSFSRASTYIIQQLSIMPHLFYCQNGEKEVVHG